MEIVDFTTPAGDVMKVTSEAEVRFLWEKIFGEDEYGGLEYSPGCTVVDVGGNCGVFSRYAAKRGAGKVYAFEPIPLLFECLQANVRPQDVVQRVAVSDVGGVDVTLDYLPNYTLLSGSAAATNQEVYAKAEGSRATAEQVAKAFESVPCQATTATLTQLLKDVPAIDVLKIDVEGMEHKVLLGMDAALFARVRQVVIEVHDVDTRVEDIKSLLTAHGFAVTQTDFAPPSFLLGSDARPAKNLSTCMVAGIRQSQKNE